LKGKDATDIYGKKGKNGVVLITMKKPGNKKEIFVTYRDKDSLGTITRDKPRIIIDGKEVSETEMKNLDPGNIMNITVNKNDFETMQPGDKKNKGTIRIITKNSGSNGKSEGSGTSFSTSSSSSSDGKTTTIVVTGKKIGEGNSSSTYTITGSPDGSKKTLEKDVVVTGYGPVKADSKYVIINTNTDTNNGKTVTNKTVNVIPDDVYVVIDGVPGKVGDVLPEDIESIQVLKGAAVKAIYGDKAEKGALIITTKKGGKSSDKDKK